MREPTKEEKAEAHGLVYGVEYDPEPNYLRLIVERDDARAERDLATAARDDIHRRFVEANEAATDLVVQLAAANRRTEKWERLYPCDKCGVLRTKAEGGTVFTVCEECWDKTADETPETADEAAS